MVNQCSTPKRGQTSQVNTGHRKAKVAELSFILELDHHRTENSNMKSSVRQSLMEDKRDCQEVW